MLLTVFSGCTDYRKISVDNVSLSSFRFRNTTSAEIVVSAEVDNPTKREISMTMGDAVLVKEGKDFVYFDLEGAPSVSPETKETVELKVNARVLDPLAAVAAGLNFRTWRKEDYTVRGKIVIRLEGAGKKTIKLKDVPLEDLINHIRYYE